jgi:tRNA A37 threonylcarbamoyladenosine synthetase subunit TsaC/SUA5/YrdC
VVVLETPRAAPPQEVTRLERWLAVRMPDTPIELVIGRNIGSVNKDAPRK